MATEPIFAATPHIAAGLIPATADTSRTAPANVTTIFTAAAGGSKVEEITLEAVGTTVAGIVNIFLYDGATYHLYDQFLLLAITLATTQLGYRASHTYSNLVLPSGWSVRVSGEVVANQSMVKVTVLGGDF